MRGMIIELKNTDTFPIRVDITYMYITASSLIMERNVMGVEEGLVFAS